jgi:four helix bundle protein
MNSNHTLPGYLWIVQLAEQISLLVGRHIQKWPTFHKAHLGDQLLRASDSIGLNISEGHVRTHEKERQHFFSYARGSIEETLFAVRRALDRGLLTRLEAAILSELLFKLRGSLKAFVETL